LITDLAPRTKYFYRFGTESSFSEEKHFISYQTDNTAELNFVAFGDSGVAECEGMYGWCEPASGQTTSLIAQDMNTTDFDMLLHIGDIAYAVGHGVRWDQFFHQIEPIAATLPYHVCIGNHEFDFVGQDFQPSWADYGSDSHGECGVPFNKRFQMPQNGNGNLWWSLNYGSVHFVLISTEHDFTKGSVQYKWLENDLKSVNRSVTPWIIMSGHRPMYTSRDYKPELLFAEKMRENLEELMDTYKVDVALWGHIHNYERSCPVFNGTCRGDLNDPQGTIHFVIGMGGMTFFFDWLAPQPDWSMFRAAQYGYITIHVPANDHTRMLILYKGDRDAMIHDTVWINKKR
jgi:acid phosphatase type 7